MTSHTMKQQLPKAQRDWEFFVACYSYREIPSSKFTEKATEELKSNLSKLGVDLKDCVIHGESIIFSAINSYSPAVLKFLIENGAPLNVTNTKGNSPLEFAKQHLKETETRVPNPNLIALATVIVDYLQNFEDIQLADNGGEDELP